jgi:hypothetical protein
MWLFLSTVGLLFLVGHMYFCRGWAIIEMLYCILISIKPWELQVVLQIATEFFICLSFFAVKGSIESWN